MPDSKKTHRIDGTQLPSNWCSLHFGSKHSPFAPFGSCPFPQQNDDCVCHLKHQNRSSFDPNQKTVL